MDLVRLRWILQDDGGFSRTMVDLVRLWWILQDYVEFQFIFFTSRHFKILRLSHSVDPVL